jgi:hypothetical protein
MRESRLMSDQKNPVDELLEGCAKYLKTMTLKKKEAICLALGLTRAEILEILKEAEHNLFVHEIITELRKDLQVSQDKNTQAPKTAE